MILNKYSFKNKFFYTGAQITWMWLLFFTFKGCDRREKPLVYAVTIVLFAHFVLGELRNLEFSNVQNYITILKL